MIGYDDDDQVISLDDDRGQRVSRDYNARGSLIEQIDGRGTLEFGYDDLGQMTSLTDPQTEVLNFAYDPEGNLTEVRLPNDIVTTNTYDDDGLLTDTRSIDGRSTTVESLAYVYDATGNRTSQTDRLSQQTLYTYDALNRLTEFDPPGASPTRYAYDAAGNRTGAGATTYTFNELNQLTRDSTGMTYDYDDAGHLIERDDGSVETRYGWDQLDQLSSVDNNRSLSIDYTYDALDRRAERDNGTAVSGAHYGDLTDIAILDTDSRGAVTQTYVRGPEGLVEQRAGGATDFPLADAHGDITTITDDVGTVDTRQTYDPWGGQLSGPALEMGYLGAQQRRSDPAADLVQMGVRSYDPALGVFVSEDPILAGVGNSRSVNRYQYVWQNPINLYDLNGREVCIPAPLVPIVKGCIDGDGPSVSVQACAGLPAALSTQVCVGQDGPRICAAPVVAVSVCTDPETATKYAQACAMGAGAGAAFAVVQGPEPRKIAINAGIGCGQQILAKLIRQLEFDDAADTLEIAGLAHDIAETFCAVVPKFC